MHPITERGVGPDARERTDARTAADRRAVTPTPPDGGFAAGDNGFAAGDNGFAAGDNGFAVGDKVFHQKFGNGRIIHREGNKLEIAFDKAGVKKVIDSFVSLA